MVNGLKGFCRNDFIELNLVKCFYKMKIILANDFISKNVFYSSKKGFQFLECVLLIRKVFQHLEMISNQRASSIYCD